MKIVRKMIYDANGEATVLPPPIKVTVAEFAKELNALAAINPKAEVVIYAKDPNINGLIVPRPIELHTHYLESHKDLYRVEIKIRKA